MGSSKSMVETGFSPPMTNFEAKMGGGTPPIDSGGRPRRPLAPHDAWDGLGGRQKAAPARFAARLANLTRFGGAKYWSIQYLL